MARRDTPRSSVPGRPEDDPFSGPSWVDRFLLPFVREPTLWPVLLVLIGHAVALIGPVLLLALRDGRRGAQGLLAALVLFSLACFRFDLRRQRRPGALSAVVSVTWVLGGTLAVVAHRYEFL